MREVERSAIVPYTAENMYALVADIESYPSFLPWCEGSRVIDGDDAEVTASLKIGAGVLNTEFTTRNVLSPPDSMTLSLVDGPFSDLEGLWKFIPLGHDGCKVELTIRFAFSSSVQDRLMGLAFENICNRLIEAFVQRATDVYGN